MQIFAKSLGRGQSERLNSAEVRQIALPLTCIINELENAREKSP